MYNIYVCVTLRNAILLRAAHAVAAAPAGPFVAHFSLATSTYTYVRVRTYVRTRGIVGASLSEDCTTCSLRRANVAGRT